MMKVLNLILFYFVWTVAVYGAAHRFLWLGPTVLMVSYFLHIYLSKVKRSDLLLALACLLLGGVIEALVSKMGLVVYAGYDPSYLFAPAWILALWVNLSMTINHSLSWLTQRYALCVIAGAVSGPLSYAAGIKMGAARTDKYLNFMLAEALLWGIIIPVLFFCAHKITRKT